MLSFVSALNYVVLAPCSNACLNARAFGPLLFMVEPRRRSGRLQKSRSSGLVAASESGFLGVSGFERREKGFGCSGFVRWCKDCDEVGDLGLEDEILEFMRKSKNPEAFPTKKELVDAGRLDLVQGIVKQGGWLSLGWDLNSDGNEEEVVGGEEIMNSASVMVRGIDNGRSVVGDGEKTESVSSNEETVDLEDSAASFSANSSHLVSSSGRLLEMTSENDMGIEGILNRLEKQRNMTFCLDLRERENSSGVSRSDSSRKDKHPITSEDEVADLERSNRATSSNPEGGQLNLAEPKFGQNRSLSNLDDWKNTSKPEMWRTWSLQRAGFSDVDFEAGEIAFDESKDEIFSITENANEPLDRREELNSCCEGINPNQIRGHLQQLESELSSMLHRLRSNPDDSVSLKGHGSSSDDSLKLSDAWEFQENEILNAQDRLRSIRAKLAVIEGKMALAIIDAKKIVEEKEKRIVDAQKSVQLLRSTCIVWPNSASEVFLAGSFDGWAAQRKMEKSSTGVFSLCMKLYPGRYEIKFIVNGMWMIDPLRPIVQNNGYENNLLIV